MGLYLPEATLRCEVTCVGLSHTDILYLSRPFIHLWGLHEWIAISRRKSKSYAVFSERCNAQRNGNITPFVSPKQNRVWISTTKSFGMCWKSFFHPWRLVASEINSCYISLPCYMLYCMRNKTGWHVRHSAVVRTALYHPVALTLASSYADLIQASSSVVVGNAIVITGLVFKPA